MDTIPTPVIEAEGDVPLTEEEREFADEFENGDDPIIGDDAPAPRVAEGDEGAEKPVVEPAAAEPEPDAVGGIKPPAAKEPEPAAEAKPEAKPAEPAAVVTAAEETAVEKLAKAAADFEKLPDLDVPAAKPAPKEEPVVQSAREIELEQLLADSKAEAAASQAELRKTQGDPIDLAELPKVEDILRRMPEGPEKDAVQKHLDDYPEVGNVTLVLAKAIAGIQAPADVKPTEGSEAANKELRDEVGALRNQAARQEHVNKIINGGRDEAGGFVKGHSDFYAVVNSAEFETWSTEQTGTVQKMLNQGDWKTCIWALDAYKESVGKTENTANAGKNKKTLEGQQKLHGASIRPGAQGAGKKDGSGAEPTFATAEEEFDYYYNKDADPKN